MSLIFKHSGRLGDIVYSLPLIKQMSEDAGVPASLYIPSDIPSRLGGNVYHPGGAYSVSKALFEYIKPLIECQSYIGELHYVPTGAVPSNVINLDRFKESGINLKAGLIQGWYRKAFGVSFPLEMPWLDVDIDKSGVGEASAKYQIIIGRTTRFCNTSINYGFLEGVNNVGFVGLEYEYEIFKKTYGINNIDYQPVRDALQLANIMKKADLYIGNQSVNFAIAEAMKIPRALEAFEPAPVACPVGGSCIEFNCTNSVISFLEKEISLRLARFPELDGDYYDSILSQEGYRRSIRERLRDFLRNKKEKRKF